MATTRSTVHFYTHDDAPRVEISPHNNGTGNNCYIGTEADHMLFTISASLEVLDTIAEQILAATDAIRARARRQLEERAS